MFRDNGQLDIQLLNRLTSSLRLVFSLPADVFFRKLSHIASQSGG